MIPLAQTLSDRVVSGQARTQPSGQATSRVGAASQAIAPTSPLNQPHGAQLTTIVNARLQAGTFLLTVGGQQIAARSDLPLTPGDRLITVVDRSGPGLLLKIAEGARSPANGLASAASALRTPQQVVDQTLRWALPRQQPVSALLSQLTELSSQKLPGGRFEALQPLLSQSNDPRQLLQPQRLIQALTNSGVLLENKLWTSPNPSLEADIKANLLRSIQNAATAPITDSDGNRLQRQLREITDSALARIETQQLTTLRDESGRRILTTDLILRDAELTTAVEVEIDRPPPSDDHLIDPEDQADAPAKEHRWQVTLNFDLPGLGKLQSLIRLDSTSVAVDFRSDQSNTREQLTTRFEQLTERLKTAGLPNSQLTAGVLKREIKNGLYPASSHHLIDVTS